QKSAAKAPAFEKPRIFQDNNGKDVVLECRSTGDPAPNYTWYQNGRELKPRAHKFDMSSSKDGAVFVNTLRLISFMNADSGTYTLVAKNQHGDATATMEVKMPRIVGLPNVRFENNNQQAVLEIKVDAGSQPVFTWSQAGKALAIGGRYGTNVQLEGAVHKVELIISDLIEKDSGTYDCEITNGVGTAFQSVNFKVPLLNKPFSCSLIIESAKESKATLPQIIGYPGNQSADAGRTFILTVDYSAGSVTPQAKVTKNGVDLTSDKRGTVRVDATKRSIVITLKNVRVEDKGAYLLQLLSEGTVCDKTSFDLDVIQDLCCFFVYGNSRDEALEEEDEVGELQVPSSKGSRRSSAAKKEEDFLNRRTSADKPALLDPKALEQSLQARRDSMNTRRTSLADAIPGFAGLKHRETPKVEKDYFIEEVQDLKIKEGSMKALLKCTFCKPTSKFRWYKNKLEIFQGPKYNFLQEGNEYALEIKRIAMEDVGKYTCKCNDTSTTCTLIVEERKQMYHFNQKLPMTAEVVRGKDLTVECSVSDPRAPVVWYHKGEKIEYVAGKVEIKRRENRCILRIVRAKPEQEGEYCCMVEGDETYIDIAVEDPDWYFTRELKAQQCYENDEVVKLECEVSDRDAEVSWFRNEKPITAGDKYEILSEQRVKRILKIKKLLCEDEGDYVCKVAKKTTMCHLTVKPDVEFRLNLIDTKGIETKRKELECRAFNPKKYPVYWFKNGEPIQMNDRVSAQEIEGSLYLIFQYLEMDDTGLYSCKIGNHETKGTLEVQECDKPPTADLSNFKNVANLKKGQSFMTAFPFKGFPIPTVSLFCNGVPVSEKINLKPVVKDNTVKLVLEDAQRTDVGKYEIKLKNESGELSVPLEVNVFDRPSKPRGPLLLTSLSANKCTLEWDPPDDDGGKPIKHYVVEKMDTEDGTWKLVKNAKTPKCDVALEEGKKYKFRVRAVNDEGESDNLETEKETLARDICDPPDAPTGLTLEDWDKDWAELRWIPPRRDNGAPVTKYIVEAKTKSKNKWETLKEVQPTTAKVPLTENEEYEFRVVAVNKAGKSEPSGTTKPMIAKPRLLKPFIIKTNIKPIKVKVGESVTLDLTYRGEPDPEATWSIESKELLDNTTIYFSSIKVLETTENIKLEFKERSAHLKIVSAQRKDTALYTLRVFNCVGEDQASIEVVALGKPSKPIGPLEVTDVTKNSATLSWKPPEDDGGTPITHYVVEKMNPNRRRWEPVAEVSKGTSVVAQKLEEGQPYHFRVMAVSSQGTSEPLETEAETIAKNPYEKPGPPEKPEIVDHDRNRIDIKWEPPEDDGGAPVTGYHVERKEPKGQRWLRLTKAPQSEREFTDDGVREGKEYQYRVIAVNAAGPGDPSPPSENVVAKPSREAPKLSLKELPLGLNQEIRLRAGEPLHMPVPITGAPKPTVTWTKDDSPLPSNAQVDDTEERTCVDIPRTVRGDSGLYKLKLANDYGQDEAIIKVVVMDKPSPPQDVDAIDVYEDRCKVVWKPPKDDGGCPITGEYDYSQMFYSYPMNSMTQADVLRCIPRRYHANSESLVVCTGFSNNFIQCHCTKQPVVLTLKIPFVFADYQVERCDATIGTWERVSGSVSDNSILVRNLVKGKQYRFRVAAINQMGMSDYAETKTPILAKNPYDPPGAPENLKIDEFDRHSVTLNWKPPKDDGGNPIKGYLVERRIPGGEWRKATPNIVQGTTAKITNVDEGQTYEFRVSAVNDAGPGEPSKATAPHTVKDPTYPPGSPENLNVDRVTKNGAKLSWNKPRRDGGAPVTGYVVEKKNENDEWVPVLNTADTCAFVPMKEGETGQFRVRAVNEEGPGEPTKPTAVLSAQDTPEAPRICTPEEGVGGPGSGVGGLKDVTLKAGQELCLAAAWFGHPKPTAVWTAGGKTVKPDGSRTKILDRPPPPPAKPGPGGVLEQPAGGTAVLEVQKVRRADTGDYELTLMNDLGQVKTSCHVEVLDVPGPPEGPLEAEDVNADEMTLRWKPPLDDGGQPVTNYILEKRLKGSDSWQKVSNFLNTTTATVRNLEVGNEYEFRVMAENAMGMGEPLVTTKPIKAKHPYDPPSGMSKPTVEDTTDDSVSLSWEPPRKGPTTGYVVEKRPKGSREWTKANTSNVVGTSYTVKGLPKGKEFEFRVVPYNLAGLGEPSEPTDVTKVQYPTTPPKIGRDAPREINARVDEPFSIRIPYTGSPPEKVQLIKAGIPVPLEGGRFKVEVTPDEVIITDMKAQKDDAGPYQVELENEKGRDSVPAGIPVPLEGGRFKVEVTPDEVIITDMKAQKDDAGPYQVELENEKGRDSVPVTVKVFGPPEAPKGPLDISNIKAESCTLSWNPPTDTGGSPITNYVVEKQDTKTGEWSTVSAFVRSPVYDVTGLDEGHMYRFRVRAANEYGVSEPLDGEKSIVAENPFTVPGAPGNLSATDVEANEVTLEWAKPRSDGGRRITGYVVEYKPASSDDWRQAPGGLVKGLKTTVDGLRKGEKYQFRVAAKNEAGVGEFCYTSRPIECKPKFTTADSPGTPVVEDVGKNHVDLTWTKPAKDGGARITGYLVEKRKKFGADWEPATADGQPVSGTQAHLDNLEENAEYEFRVRAVNAAGPGEPSQPTEIVKVRPKRATADSPGTPVVEDVGKNHVDLTWTKPAKDGGARITGYLVEKRKKFGADWEPATADGQPVSGTQAHLDNLEENAEYEFRVRAVNAAGPGEPSQPTEIVKVRPKRDKPKPPEDLEVTDLFADNCKLVWKPPEFDGGCPITDYVVEKCDALTGAWERVPTSVVGTSCPVRGLVEGKRYRFRVSAVNMMGASEPCETNSAITAKNPFDAPDAPENVKIDEFDKHGVKLSWKPPENDGGNPIQGYLIEKRTPNGEWKPATAGLVHGPEARVSDLEAGQTYEFRVSAVNDAGPGRPSKATAPQVIKDPTFPPSSPENLNVDKVNKNGVKLSWQKPRKDGGSKITGYQVEKKDDAGNWVPVKQTTEPCAFIPMKEGETSQFRVRAINDEGPGEPTKPTAPLTAVNQPEAPRIVTPEDCVGGPGTGVGGLKDIKLKAGQELRLAAAWFGHPAPTLSWTLDDKPIRPDGKKVIESSESLPPPAHPGPGGPLELSPGAVAVLTIPKARRADAGQYKLTLMNDQGQATTSCKVDVIDVPGAPTGPLEATDVKADEITLSWKAPEDDGGEPITNYILEKKPKNSTVWEKVSGFLHAPTATVRNLEEGTEYEFRVMAENAMGVSEPLTTERAIKAKHPFDPPSGMSKPTVEDTSDDSVTLAWDPPRKGPVTGYVVEKRAKGEKSWSKANMAPISGTNYTVKNLPKGKEFEFRVVPVNAAGPGEPSEPTSMVKVQKPVISTPFGFNVLVTFDNVYYKSSGASTPVPTSAQERLVGFTCEECGKCCKSKAGLVAHHRVHDNESVGTSTVAQLACADCFRLFPTNIGLSQHRRDAHPTQHNADKLGRVKYSGTRWSQQESQSLLRLANNLYPSCGTQTELFTRLEQYFPGRSAISIKTRLRVLNWQAQQDESSSGEPEQTIGQTTAYSSEADDYSVWFKQTVDCTVSLLESHADRSLASVDLLAFARGLQSGIMTPEQVLSLLDLHASRTFPHTWKTVSRRRRQLAHRIPVNRKQIRRANYAAIQTLYHQRRKDAASAVLDGSWKDLYKGNCGLPMDAEQYWKQVLSAPKHADSRPSRIVVPSDWSLIEPITGEEVGPAPKIGIDAPREINARLGEPCKIRIPFTGGPPENVEMLKNGIPVPLDGDRFKVEVTPDEVIITDTKVEKGDAGPYQIKLKNEKGEATAPITIKVQGPPEAPNGPLTINDIKGDSCKLAWNPPTDNGGSPVTNYVVEKLDKRTGDWVPVSRFVRGTEYEVTGLEEGNQYKFRVRAENEFGVSEPLEADRAITAENPATAPDSPHSLNVADVDSDKVTLEWAKPRNDGGKRINGYVVEYKPVNSTEWQRGPTVRETTATVDGLKKGEKYVFRVYAKNDVGSGEPSTPTRPVECKPKYTTADSPGQPTVDDIGKNSIDLSWARPTKDGGARITGYVVEKRHKNSPDWEPATPDGQPVTGNQAHIDGLKENEDYEFRVKPVNAAGVGAPSEPTPLIKIRPKKDRPDGPEEVKVEDLLADSCKLVWKAPENDGGYPITSYIVEKCDALTGTWEKVPASITGTSCPVRGLVEGKRYRFRVTAVNALGSSEPTEAIGVYTAKNPFDSEILLTFGIRHASVTGETTGLVLSKFLSDVPDSPENLNIDSYDKHSVNLSWNPPKHDGGNPIKGYLVEKRTPKGEWKPATSGLVTGPSVYLPGLEQGQTYEFRVSAVNDAGPGRPSRATAPQVIKDPSYPAAAPESLNVDKVNKNGVKLSWQKPRKDGGSKITGYQVEKKDDAGNWVPVKQTTEPCAFIPMKEGETSQFRVRAINDEGPGEPTKPTAPLTAVNQPEAPRIVTPEDCVGGPGTGVGGLKDVTLKAGQELKLPVAWFGHPVPTFSWTLDGKPIRIDGSRVTSTDEPLPPPAHPGPGGPLEQSPGAITALKVGKVTRADRGRYQLTMSNDLGQATTSCHVEVLVATLHLHFSGVLHLRLFRFASPDVPGSPGGPLEAVEVKADEITLKWKAPEDDGGQPITNYILEKRPKGSDTWQKVSAFLKSPTATVRNLEEGKEYEFRVMAENPMGVSEPLVTERAVKARHPFDPPSGMSTPHVEEVTDDSVTLAWEPPHKGPTTGYIVEKRAKGDRNWSKVNAHPISGTEYTVKSLPQGKEFEFRVVPVNAAGSGEPSDPTPLTKIQRPTEAPKIGRDAPREINAANEEPFKIRIPYTGSPPDDVEVTKDGKPFSVNSGRFQLTITPDEVIITDTKADKSDEGDYKIKLKNSKGEDTLPLKIRVRGPPSAPQGPLEVSNIKADSCTLSWGPPTDNGGSPVSHYVIERQNPATGEWMSVSKFVRSPEYDVLGLEEGQKHNFRVRAANEFGLSEPLELDRPFISENPKIPPEAPGVPEVADVDSDTVTLEWTKPRNDGGGRINGYVVEVRPASGGDWEKAQTGPVKGTSATVIGLKKGEKYMFRVSAKNDAGVGEPSRPTRPVECKPKHTPADAPGTVNVDGVGKNHVDLSWTRPIRDGGARILGYQVEMRKKDSPDWVPVNPDGQPITSNYCHVDGLNEGDDCQFRVRTLNAAGLGEPSTPTPMIRVEDRKATETPDFVYKIRPTTAPLGGTAVFEAQVDGQPTPDVRWYRDGIELVPGPRVRIRPPGPDGKAVLELTDLDDRDNGTITCQLSNPSGKNSCSAPLEVLAIPRPLSNVDDKVASEGDLIKIKVPYLGRGNIELKLKRDGREVPESSRVKLVDLDGIATVQLKDITRDMGGDYSLEIGNESGSCNVPFTVRVLSPPSECQGPLVASDTTPFSTRLSWKPPRSDGGSKVTHYVIEKMEVGRDRWVPVSSGTREPTCEVQGLQENAKYLFRVAAVNDCGQGDWIQLPAPLVARYPFDKPSKPGEVTCTSVGADFVNLTWGRPASDGGGRLRGYIVEKRDIGSQNWSRVTPHPVLTTSYNVPNLIEDITYEFRVIAVNDAGESEPSVVNQPVLVKDPKAVSRPNLVGSLRPQTVHEGRDVEFEIEVDCPSAYDVIWSKGPRDLVPSHRIEMTKEGRKHVLRICDCGLEDAEEYSVKVINRAGSKVSRAPLTVKSKPRINLPSRWQEPTEWDKGDTIQIKVPFTGFPKPTAKWTLNGKELKEGKQVQTVMKDRYAIIALENVGEEFAGKLNVQLENDMGSDSATIELRVNDRPPPPINLRVEGVSDGSALLSWSMPANTGYISQYIIERCELPGDNWIRAGTNRFSTYNCEGLRNGKEYKFRVIAENLHGRSDPCQPTEARLIQPEKPQRGDRRDRGGGRGDYDGPPIDNYDRFYRNIWDRTVPLPTQVHKGESVYDYYDILEELGSGAFGVVHRCREKSTGNFYACKFVEVNTPQDRQVVHNEIEVMKELHHPKLIRLHEAFEDKNEMALVMELLSGGELFDRIADDRNQMSEAEVANYIRQVCEGIQHMHDNNIIHLDVKPEDIICETSKSTNIKLVDFGLSKKLNPNEPVRVTTATPEFAAPEIARYEPVGFYTDMWAIGVLTYVLLSGLSPFSGSSTEETLERVVQGRYTFDHENFRGISDGAKDFISKLLQKQPSQRMTVYEALEHPWLNSVLSDDQRKRIPPSRYKQCQQSMHDRMGEIWQRNPAIGHIANYSSLRQNKRDKYKIHETNFDRKEAGPRFVKWPQNQLVVEGQNAQFDCRVLALSEPTVTWHFNEVQLTQSVKHMQRYAGHDYSLKINRVRPEDTGHYTVRAENSFGRREYPVMLTVQPIQEIKRETSQPPKRKRIELQPIEMFQEELTRPRFAFHLRNRYIQEGSSVKLTCTADGNPTPQMTWFKDGYELHRGGGNYEIETMLGISSLELYSCTEDDSGRYTCVAKNSQGEDETNCKLIVEQSRVRRFLNARAGERGLRSSSQQPMGSDYRTMNSEAGRSRRIQGSLTRLTERHTSETRELRDGWEVSEARTMSRIVERRDSTISNEVPPSPTIPAPKVQQPLVPPPQLVQGERLVLSVEFSETNRQTSIRWLHNGMELQSDTEYNIVTTGDNKTSRLTIENVGLKHAGTYEVQATSKGGSSTSQTQVSVQVKPEPTQSELPNGFAEEIVEGKNEVLLDGPQSPPLFTTHPIGQLLEEGAELILECQFSGAPIPEVTWSCNGNAIQAAHSVVQENYSSRLELPSVNLGDAGSYECYAKNVAGEARSVAHVLVKAPNEDLPGPEFVSVPQSATIKEGSSTILECAFTPDTVTSVEWRRNDKLIDPSRIEFDDSASSSICRLLDVRHRKDNGVYKINATGPNGIISTWTFALQVVAADVDDHEEEFS
ncbi:hypothetical protein T265_15051, partial [Opisthorchis viverrini]